MDEFNYYSAILQNNTFSGSFVGQNIVALQRVDSTNTYIKNLLANSEPVTEGTVIMAEEQFAGRGQVTNSWVSDPGLNLTFSVLLCPTFLLPENQFKLNIAVSLAINDTLNAIIGSDVKIKWPNDIYIRNKKLGGVLIENILKGREWKYAIIGIGLNVNQSNFPDYLTNATSIKKILHQDYDLKDLLNDLCKSLNKRYLQLKNNEESLHQEYLKHLFGYKQQQKFMIDGQEVEAIIEGVDEKGLLLLKLNNQVYSYGFKEVSFIIP